MSMKASRLRLRPFAVMPGEFCDQVYYDLQGPLKLVSTSSSNANSIVTYGAHILKFWQPENILGCSSCRSVSIISSEAVSGQLNI